jgi:uncharacterized damage-inducible protein DinB
MPFVLTFLRDLYAHQEWADAELWRAIGAHPPARDDAATHKRLHHIALVQRAFLWIVGDRKVAFAATAPEDFDSFESLVAYGRAYHDEVRPFVDAVTEAQLAEPVEVPWFKDPPPLRINVAEALTQCAMHSHYHRGQNATRLRELGGDPPLTDLIVWYWKERPANAALSR